VERTELIRKYRWLRDFSFPRRFPLVQFPNDPLILAFLSGLLAAHLHGSGHDYASAVSYLAMFVWAYLEFAQGVNWFRHLLGLVYVVSTALHLGRALGH
jgi:hypothetical protein